jgi:hypothetical protein
VAYGSSTWGNGYWYGIKCGTTYCVLSCYGSGYDNSFNFDTPKTDWYHVAVTSADGKNHKIYINGSLAFEGTTSGAAPSSYSCFAIGGNTYEGNSKTESYNGYISDVRFYNSALSDKQIKKLYNPNYGTFEGWSGYKAVLVEEIEEVEPQTASVDNGVMTVAESDTNVVIVSGSGKEGVDGEYPLSNGKTEQEAVYTKDNGYYFEYYAELQEWFIRNSNGTPSCEAFSTNDKNPWDVTAWSSNLSDVNENMTVTLAPAADPDVPDQPEEPETPEVKVKKYYVFEETLTTGLTYGYGFTPEVGKIYDAEAMIRAELILKGYSENETVIAVQKNSKSSNYTQIGFYINCGDSGSVDWGDGTADSFGVGSSVEISHDYGSAITDEHIIRIQSDSVSRITINGTDPKTPRLITRVIQLGNSLTSMNGMFSNCSGLTRIEDSVQIPDTVTDMANAFSECNNLVYVPASLRMPAKCTDYSNAFYIVGLVVDMTHWFDKFADTPAGTKIKMYYGFGGYQGTGVTGVTGTLPANLLWNNPNITWKSTAYCFYGRTGLSNYNEIPSSWGGGGA